jgi:hypothetical protein
LSSPKATSGEAHILPSLPVNDLLPETSVLTALTGCLLFDDDRSLNCHFGTSQARRSARRKFTSSDAVFELICAVTLTTLRLPHCPF